MLHDRDLTAHSQPTVRVSLLREIDLLHGHTKFAVDVKASVLIAFVVCAAIARADVPRINSGGRIAAIRHVPLLAAI